MKRLVLACTLGILFLASPNLMGQKVNIGINGAVALPFGDFSDFVDLGFGGDVSLDYYFNDKFDLGVEVGYRTFAFDEGLGDGNYNIIPLQLTAGYHTDIDDWIDFYGELAGGAYIVSLSEGNSDSETYGGISPRLGLAFELTDELFLDVNVSYTTIFVDGPAEPNWLGLNVGLLYTLGEF